MVDAVACGLQLPVHSVRLALPGQDGADAGAWAHRQAQPDATNPGAILEAHLIELRNDAAELLP